MRAEIRRQGRVPAVLFAPGEIDKKIISVCQKEMSALVRKHSLSGVQCEVFNLEVSSAIGDGDVEQPIKVQAIPKQVIMHVTDKSVTNVCFMTVKPETTVRVRIPVVTQGDDVCPGSKKGGFIHVIRREIAVTTRSDNIPKLFLMDVSMLDIGQVMKISDIQVPQGVRISEPNISLPIIRVGGKTRGAA